MEPDAMITIISEMKNQNYNAVSPHTDQNGHHWISTSRFWSITSENMHLNTELGDSQSVYGGRVL